MDGIPREGYYYYLDEAAEITPEQWELLRLRTMTNQEKFLEFHKKHGEYIATEPSLPPTEVRVLRHDLLSEEITEYRLARTIEDFAKELADILYVCYGAAIDFGVDLDRVFDEVHKSNMTKDIKKI